MPRIRLLCEQSHSTFTIVSSDRIGKLQKRKRSDMQKKNEKDKIRNERKKRLLNDCTTRENNKIANERTVLCRYVSAIFIIDIMLECIA